MKAEPSALLRHIWRRGRFEFGRRLRRPVEGRFQSYAYTLPDRYPWLFDFAAERLGRIAAPRLLSFGCSRGDEVFSLARRLPQATIKGIDIDPRNIAACRARLEPAQGHVRVAGDAFERCVVQADAGLAVHHRDRRRYCAAVADRLLDLARDPKVVRAGQAVADDRALQRDDRPALGEGGLDLGMDQHAGSFAHRTGATTSVATAATAKEIRDALIHDATVMCSHDCTWPQARTHQPM